MSVPCAVCSLSNVISMLSRPASTHGAPQDATVHNTNRSRFCASEALTISHKDKITIISRCRPTLTQALTESTTVGRTATSSSRSSSSDSLRHENVREALAQTLLGYDSSSKDARLEMNKGGRSHAAHPRLDSVESTSALDTTARVHARDVQSARFMKHSTSKPIARARRTLSSAVSRTTCTNSTRRAPPKFAVRWHRNSNLAEHHVDSKNFAGLHNNACSSTSSPNVGTSPRNVEIAREVSNPNEADTLLDLAIRSDLLTSRQALRTPRVQVTVARDNYNDPVRAHVQKYSRRLRRPLSYSEFLSSQQKPMIARTCTF